MPKPTNNQSKILGVEIDTREKIMLMKQGLIPLDLELIRRFEANLSQRQHEQNLKAEQKKQDNVIDNSAQDLQPGPRNLSETRSSEDVQDDIQSNY